MSEIKCSQCDNSIRDHRWGRIKASADWFFMKNGDAFCPNHVPDWVNTWRAKK